MKARVIRVIIGLLCVVAALWPGSLAITLFRYVLVPRLTAGPNVHIHETVIVCGRELQGWELYAVPSIAALAAIALVGGGLFLILSRSHDAA
jgi:hypothetical protein